MCGRLSLGVTKKDLENYYNSKLTFSFRPTYNAAPSQTLPIVKNNNPNKIVPATWGFLPEWMQDQRPAGFINARSETIFEKPAFKKAANSQRCLIPADGFFEWKKIGNRKQPYYIHLKDKGIFSLAGLWESFKKGSKEILTFTILTVEPNSLIKKIHNRMPVMLDKKQEQIWLQENNTSQLKKILDPFNSLKMKAYPISLSINTPANNDPKYLEPV